MSIKDMSSSHRNLIGWIGVALVVIGGIISMHSRISANEVKINDTIVTVDELQKESKAIKDLLYEMRLENQRNFTEVQLQLKDKANRETEK